MSAALVDYVPHIPRPTDGDRAGRQAADRTLRLVPVPDHDPAAVPGPPRGVPQPRTPADHQLRLIVSDPAPPRRGWADPVPTAADQLPDAQDFGRRVAQVVIDVLAGHRPATQLLRWARPDVFEALRARVAITTAPRSGGPTRRPVVRSVRACQITATAVEASAVVVEGDRVRALAMRLEGLDGRWRIAALVIG